MLIHIVTNHGTMDLLPSYSDSLKVFTDYDKAHAQFKEWRGADSMADAFAGAFNNRATCAGVKQVYKSGDIDVELFTTEITE